MMALAQDRLLGKTVKSSYSKSCTLFCFLRLCVIWRKELQILILLYDVLHPALKRFSKIPSGGGATFWLELLLKNSRNARQLFLTIGTCFLYWRLCAMLTRQQASLSLRTTDTRQPRFSATLMLLLKYHGNISCNSSGVGNFAEEHPDPKILLVLFSIGTVSSKNTLYCKRVLSGL